MDEVSVDLLLLPILIALAIISLVISAWLTYKASQHIRLLTLSLRQLTHLMQRLSAQERERLILSEFNVDTPPDGSSQQTPGEKW